MAENSYSIENFAKFGFSKAPSLWKEEDALRTPTEVGSRVIDDYFMENLGRTR